MVLFFNIVSLLFFSAFESSAFWVPPKPDKNDALDLHDFYNGLFVSLEANPTTAIESAGLFEGDIDLDEDNLTQMGAISYSDTLWPNAVIPYIISKSFSDKERGVIARAILELQSSTCVRFVPHKNENEYIFIKKEKGCRSHVGMQGGRQIVSLGIGCIYVSTAVHELMHALGFWHEQSRADRDNFVVINWKNIPSRNKHNFNKHSMGATEFLHYPYDPRSVMHYAFNEFAIDRKVPTIIPRQKGLAIAPSKTLSQIDKKEINKLYKCCERRPDTYEC